MKMTLLGILMAAAAFGAAGSASADDAAYSCLGSNGAVVLTNSPNGGRCEKVATASAATTPAAPAAAAVAASAPADVEPDVAAPAAANGAVAAHPSTTSDASAVPPPADAQAAALRVRTAREQRLAQRRDAAIQQTRDAIGSTNPTAGVNRAVNRKYLMTNRAAYQQAHGVVQP